MDPAVAELEAYRVKTGGAPVSCLVADVGNRKGTEPINMYMVSAFNEEGRQYSFSITDLNHLTVDQRLKVAEVDALLSIAQELSALNPRNTSTSDDDGNAIKRWGIVTGRAKPQACSR